MDKSVNCKDLGSTCDFSVCAKTESELFEGVLNHGRTVHGMTEFSPDFYNKVRSSMRDKYCDLGELLCQGGECCC